jgi:hypothetical protein
MPHIEPAPIGRPEDGEVELAWSLPPRPEHLGLAGVAEQATDFRLEDRARHHGLAAVAAPHMMLGPAVHALLGPDPRHGHILHVLSGRYAPHVHRHGPPIRLAT